MTLNQAKIVRMVLRRRGKRKNVSVYTTDTMTTDTKVITSNIYLKANVYGKK